MALRSEVELSNTRQKLAEVESRYELRRRETPKNAALHQLTLRSLKRVITQLKEEIAVYQAHR